MKNKKFNGPWRPLRRKDASRLGTCQRFGSITSGCFGYRNGEVRRREAGDTPLLRGRAGVGARESTPGSVSKSAEVLEACGLPTHRLIEVELRCRFTPFRLVDGGLIPIEALHHRRGSGGRNRRRRSGLADMEEDALYRCRFGDERDQPHLAAAFRADQGQQFVSYPPFTVIWPQAKTATILPFVAGCTQNVIRINCRCASHSVGNP